MLSLRSISRLLWAATLLSLPVTSFRFMPFMGAGTYVRPLALYPLALLLPVLLLRIRCGEIKRPWPGALSVLLAFLLLALVSTAYGALLAPVELRGTDFWDRALRAWVTIAIGLGFFLGAIWMNQDEDDLKFSVKWLLAGLVAHLLWGAIQFIGLNSGQRKQLVDIQNLFSVRGLVKNKRISGFAYEPSWLAGQIATLYLPWLVAAILTRYRVFRGRFAVWIEPALLLAALMGVLMTYSRSGLFVCMLAGLVTFVLAGRPALAGFLAWFRDGFNRARISPGSGTGHWTGIRAVFRVAGARLILIAILIGMFAAGGFFLADKGYIATFFKSEKTDLFAYAVDVYLGPRLAYAAASLPAFQTHPLTGVGLGASGFWIYPNMPDWVLAGVPEISNQMSPDANNYPNPKNLYVRLLAETGLPGLVVFLAFYLVLFADTLSLLHRQSAAARWLAAAGIFALAAVMLQGISQDSFAMPEMWVNIGLLAGACASLSSSPDPKILSVKKSEP